MKLSCLSCCLLFMHMSLCIRARVTPNTAIRLPLMKRLINDPVKLYNELSTEYLVKIEIGTPPQSFLVSLDTGSADTWIPSTRCPKRICTLNRYDSRKSTTFSASRTSFSINYAQGRVSALYGKDKMRIGSMEVQQQTFGLASSVGDHIIAPTRNNVTSNGILGLAFPGLAASSGSEQAYDPLPFHLLSQLPEPVFSIYLGPMRSLGWFGELSLGASNPERYRGDLVYMPVQTNLHSGTNKQVYTYWSVGLEAINVIQNNQNRSVELEEGGPMSVQNTMLDTGTTFSYLSKATALSLIQQLFDTDSLTQDLATGLYLVDCSYRKSGISIEWVFEGEEGASIRWLMNIQDLIVRSSTGGNQCGFTITHTDIKNDNFILGANVLRYAYWVFDMKQKRVGLAPAIHAKSEVS
ncbi:aspartic peptidase domain-containing protein [Sporodiniella umbellata]|nr:aspartic peptidase domain-containing protein [Sporodiniella umbellata]